LILLTFGRKQKHPIGTKTHTLSVT